MEGYKPFCLPLYDDEGLTGRQEEFGLLCADALLRLGTTFETSQDEGERTRAIMGAVVIGGALALLLLSQSGDRAAHLVKVDALLKLEKRMMA